MRTLCSVVLSAPQVAVTARREWEQSSASPLNQALPYAPIVNFDSLLEASGPQPAGFAASNSSSSNGSTVYATEGLPAGGDSIVQEDLVLWVSSGLQHLPGSEGGARLAAGTPTARNMVMSRPDLATHHAAVHERTMQHISLTLVSV